MEQRHSSPRIGCIGMTTVSLTVAQAFDIALKTYVWGR
jgi:hypothetical protein